jgi:hypothetical protein
MEGIPMLTKRPGPFLTEGDTKLNKKVKRVPGAKSVRHRKLLTKLAAKSKRDNLL